MANALHLIDGYTEYVVTCSRVYKDGKGFVEFCNEPGFFEFLARKLASFNVKEVTVTDNCGISHTAYDITENRVAFEYLFDRQYARFNLEFVYRASFNLGWDYKQFLPWKFKDAFSPMITEYRYLSKSEIAELEF